MQLNIDLSIEDIFKGLNSKHITYIKTLLPEQSYTMNSLLESITYLTPQQQWEVDNFLHKARKVQLLRMFIKIFIVVFSISILLLIIFMILV